MTYTDQHKNLAIKFGEEIHKKQGTALDAISIGELMIAAFLLELTKLDGPKAKVQSLHCVWHICCAVDLLVDANKEFLNGLN